MAAETNRLEALVAAVSDGDAVDWTSEVETATDEHEAALVRSLALVARIAETHRSVDDESERTTFAPGAPTHDIDPGALPTVAPQVAEPFTGPRQVAHYRVIRELGAGGMGTVFEAHDERMDRRVALKVLSRHQAPSEKAEARYEREAWIAGRLDHPALVKVYDRGAWEELSYYSMELVHGGSLHDVVRNMKRWGRDDRLHLEFGSSEYVTWAVSRVIEAARGLEYAHRQGVVHRDVKPMNLLIFPETGSVKIADFGLAVDAAATRLTTAGKILGTLVYMAPEQILGKPDAIGPATDVYALGVTLFELLTLDFPYTGSTQQLYMNAVLTAEARRPSKLNERVSRDLEIVIRKTLEKKPGDRYASAAEFADDLENVLRLRPIRARPPGRAERVAKWVRRRPIHAALAATLSVAAPTVAVLSLRAVQHARQAARMEVDELWKQVGRLDMRGRDEEALEKLSELLERAPGHLLARRARAVLWMRAAGNARDAGQIRALEEQALGEVARILDQAPGLSWPHALGAILLHRFGRESAARLEEELARKARTDPPSEDDLLSDALLAREAGQSAEAVRLLSELIARRPNGLEALVYRGETLEDLGQLDAAIEDFRVASALAPDDFYWIYQLGDLYLRHGREEQAAAQFRRAVDLAPDNALLREDLAHSYLDGGRAAARAGDASKARDYFEQAEREARRSLDLDAGLVWAHVNLGASLMEHNRLRESADPERTAEAIRHYEAALASLKGATAGPRVKAYAAALVNTCDAWTQLRELERALPVCREAADHLPDEAASFYNLAGVYALLGRQEEAFAALDKDVELGDADWEYLAADRWFEGLRGDPRFDGLIGKMKAVKTKTAGGDS